MMIQICFLLVLLHYNAHEIGVIYTINMLPLIGTNGGGLAISERVLSYQLSVLDTGMI